MVRKVLTVIVSNALTVYLIALMWPQFGLYGIQIEPMSALTIPLFFVLGVVFWLCFDLIRRVVKIVAKPLSWLTLGLINRVITIGVLYLFAHIINELQLDVTIIMGQIWEVLIVALLISILHLILK